jgi:hypothetical protein
MEVEMATKKDAWYLGSRAQSLALMYLTRRPDLIIQKSTIGQVLDLLVAIPRGGGYSGRFLGIQTRGAVSARKTGKNAISLPADVARKELSLSQDVPFPVCLFFFTMEDDVGYYKWIKEPSLGTTGTPKLMLNKGTELKKLTNRELDTIISKVNTWYDKNEAVRATA